MNPLANRMPLQPTAWKLFFRFRSGRLSHYVFQANVSSPQSLNLPAVGAACPFVAPRHSYRQSFYKEIQAPHPFG